MPCFQFARVWGQMGRSLLLFRRETDFSGNNLIKVIIDCLGVGLLKPDDEIVSMHVTQVRVSRR